MMIRPMKIPTIVRGMPSLASMHASMMATLLFGAGIGNELAGMAVTALVGLTPAPMPLPGPRTSRQAAPVSIDSIVSAHLFGQAAVLAAQNPDDAPVTTASLKLVGTLSSPDPTVGVALVTDETRSSVLQVGESLSGASLRYVYADHVILERAGILERLVLERPAASPLIAPANVKPPVAPRRRHRSAA